MYWQGTPPKLGCNSSWELDKCTESSRCWTPPPYNLESLLCRMADKSDDESDDNFDSTTNEKLFEKIKKLEKEKVELERKNSERQMLEQKLKDLKGTVTTLKSGQASGSGKNRTPTRSPGGDKGRSRGAAVDNSVSSETRAKMKALQNRYLDSGDATRSGLVGGDSEDDDETDEETEGKNLDRVMSVDHKMKLQEQRDTLVESMIPDDIFNDLIANRVLTTSDVSRIKEKNTRESINEELLNNLMRRSDRAFYVFVKSLKKTLQGYLADLIDEPAPKPVKRKRKRQTGQVNVSVDCEDIQPINKKRATCSCQEVEEQILDMAKNAYRNIRRRDATPSSFEQFRKELQSTNEVIRDSMEIMNTLKMLCEHSRSIDDISYGSVKFTLRCNSVLGLKDLWRMYTSGKLIEILQNGLVTDKLKQSCGAKSIKLRVRIAEEEYLQCLRELESAERYSTLGRPCLKKSKSCHLRLKTKSMSPCTSSENMAVMSAPLGAVEPEPRRAFKEIHQNLIHVSSDPGQKRKKLTTECEKVVIPSKRLFYHVRLRSRNSVLETS